MASLLREMSGLPLADFVQSHSRAVASEAKDAYRGLTRAQLSHAADGIRVQASAGIAALQACGAQDEEESGGADAADAAREAQQAMAVAALRTCAHLAASMLAVCREQQQTAPPALLAAAQLLHDNCLLGFGTMPALEEPVVKLCCDWWLCGEAGREHLIAYMLPYCLGRAVATSKAVHVKQVHAVREAFELLDYDDSSIEYISQLLLRAAICPAFLHRPEGRRFLAGTLLCLHPQLVREAASVMLHQVCAGRPSVLSACGDILLRGWREASSACLLEVEAAIQDLVTRALAASTPAMSANLRGVLCELHAAKRMGTSGSVDAMLVRLHEPLLYRALAAANPAVRRNALELLLDAFPLVDPEAPAEEEDGALRRQFEALTQLMGDGAPAVRAAAAAGICRVLNLFWEIVPAPTTALYVARLTEQLAFDSSSPAVRVAVLEGLTLLVDNTHAQAVLARALPRLAPLVADPAPRVRAALADLLACISGSRGLHWWDVVPAGELLEALTSEPVPEVAGRWLATLRPSYFPGPVEGVARVAGLLRAQPGPGRAFCALLAGPLLSDGAPALGASVAGEDVVALAAALLRHLAEHPPGEEGADEDVRSPPHKQRGGARRGRGAKAGATGGGGAAAAAPGAAGSKRRKAPTAAALRGSGGEGEGEEEGEVLARHGESVESWEAILAGVAELCVGIGRALEQGTCGEADVAAAFQPQALQQLLNSCPSTAAQRQVWRIAHALAGTPASSQLQTNLMQLLAHGQLLASVEAAAPGALTAQQEQLVGVLGVLAAGPTGPKLAAMLCQALGAEWRSGPATVAAPRGASRKGAAAAGDDDGDVACSSCGRPQPEDSMLLCDGCEAGYHMECMVPAVAAVPDGHWFCPGCQADVRGCELAAGEACRYLAILLGLPDGRALLQHADGTAPSPLQRLLPALQGSGVGAVVAAARPAPDGRGWFERAGEVQQALDWGLLWLRAALHLMHAPSQHPGGHGGADGDGATASAAAAVAAAAAAGADAVAAACALVGGAGRAADDDDDDDDAGVVAAGAAAAAQRWLALASDAMRLSAAGRPLGGDAAAHFAAAAHAGAALLQAAPPSWEEAGTDAWDSAAHGLLREEVSLLRWLLADAAAAGADPEEGGCVAPAAARPSSLSALAGEVLAVASSGQVAGAVGAVRGELPGLVAALLDDRAQVGHSWLLPVAGAVGEVLQEAPPQGEDPENADPNLPSPGADGDLAAMKRGGSAAVAAQRAPPLPPLAAAIVHAAQLKKVGASLAAVCWAAAGQWAQGRQWGPALGAAQLAMRAGTQRSRLQISGQLQLLRQCAEERGEGSAAASALARLIA